MKIFLIILVVIVVLVLLAFLVLYCLAKKRLIGFDGESYIRIKPNRKGEFK